MQLQPWIIYALLAAVAAACTNIFAKIGMEGIDSTMATAIRASVGMIYLILFAAAQHKWRELKTLHPKAVLMIVLAGLAGATSWLFQYAALKDGLASKVAAIDKMSVPIAVVLAVIFLKDKLLPLNWAGVALIVVGAYFVAYKPAEARGIPVNPQTTTAPANPTSHP